MGFKKLLGGVITRQKLQKVIDEHKKKGEVACIEIDIYGDCTLHVAISEEGEVIPATKCGDSPAVPVRGPSTIRDLTEQMNEKHWNVIDIEESWFAKYDLPTRQS